jgi:predicted lipoprotein with Yx(FWY)xxD motif
MAPDNGNMNAFIHTAAVMLNGKKVQVLTTNKGFMLYYYTKDTMQTSNCTGGCAMNWPPLLAPKGAMTISSSVTLPHKLSIHMTPNGNQVFYDGHPLYTYAGDMQAGQFNGRGLGNAWYLVGVNL